VKREILHLSDPSKSIPLTKISSSPLITADFVKALVNLLEALPRAPIKILRNSINNEQWFEGIVLSTILFEIIGLLKLQNYFDGKIEPNRFERLSLEQIIMFLFCSGLIDQRTYCRMMEVRDVRNKLVHELGTGLVLKPKQGKRTIEKAIECLKVMGLPE
jgi:hypothetical protein